MNAAFLLSVAILAVLATILLSPKSLSSNEKVQAVRLHGERVFRLQNDVVSRLIDAYESGALRSPREEAALLAAEGRIEHDCRHLNEAAGLSAGGSEPALALRMRVLASLDSCEASALAIRSQLDRDAVALRVSLAGHLAEDSGIIPTILD